jgi:ABC-type bacteriocin/lantibiotic exporter with double-glycine peptidase domain
VQVKQIKIKEYFKIYGKIIPKKRSCKIIVIAFLNAMLEVITIGAAAIFVKVVTTGAESDLLSSTKIFSNTNQQISKYITNDNFVIIFAIIIIIKYIYSLYYFNVIYKEIFEFATKTNTLISSAILGRKYIELKSKKFQDTKNIFFKEIDYYIAYFIQPLFLLISDIFQIILLSTLMIIILPSITFVAIGVLLMIIYYVNKLVKNKVTFYSEILTLQQRERTNIIGNFYSNILFWHVKDLGFKINNYFIRENQKIGESSAKLNYYQQIPRTSFELIIFLVFCIMYLINNKSETHEYFNYVLIGLGSIRLMPSAVKISSFIQSALSARIVVNTLNSIIIKEEEITKTEIIKIEDFKNCIKLTKGWFLYKNNWIIKDCNLIIQKNDIISIAGKSGAGKSTLIEIILKQLDLTYGKIEYDGIDITNKKINMSSIIGIVPQFTQFNNNTLRENLLFGINNEVKEKDIDEVLIKCNLKELVSRLPNGLETKIDNSSNNISGGERQRIALARCLLDKNVKILVFDEVTSALDNENSIKILEMLIKLKSVYTIIFITHDDLVKKYCEKNYIINNNKIELN